MSEDPFKLKSGDIVLYNDTEYYFRPNGSVGILYANYQDYVNRVQPYYVATSKLKLKEAGQVSKEEELSEETSKFVPLSESEYSDLLSKFGLLCVTSDNKSSNMISNKSNTSHRDLYEAHHYITNIQHDLSYDKDCKSKVIFCDKDGNICNDLKKLKNDNWKIDNNPVYIAQPAFLKGYKLVHRDSLEGQQNFRIFYELDDGVKTRDVFKAYRMSTKKDQGKIAINIKGYGQIVIRESQKYFACDV